MELHTCMRWISRRTRPKQLPDGFPGLPGARRPPTTAARRTNYAPTSSQTSCSGEKLATSRPPHPMLPATARQMWKCGWTLRPSSGSMSATPTYLAMGLSSRTSHGKLPATSVVAGDSHLPIPATATPSPLGPSGADQRLLRYWPCVPSSRHACFPAAGLLRPIAISTTRCHGYQEVPLRRETSLPCAATTIASRVKLDGRTCRHQLVL